VVRAIPSLRAPAAVAAGLVVLTTVAVMPFTGVLGGTAVAALLFLGLIVGLLALSARDGCSILTLVVVLLLLVPQPYVLVGPLKSVGNPALLVALGGLAIWAASRVLNLSQAAELHPVRWVLLAFAVAACGAYAAGMLRDLTTGERSSMDRVVFQHLALLGVGLLAVDELGTRERVTTLLQRLVLVGGVAAGIGILEFAFTGFDFRDLMLLPGLTASGAALLFGVNAWCLDGKGMVWRETLPVCAGDVFDVRALVVLECMAAVSATTVVMALLRNGPPPLVVGVSVAACWLVVLVQVLAIVMSWSVRSPYSADLSSPRATPAPHAAMAGYAGKLSLVTTLTGMVFTTVSTGPWAWLPAVLALPFLVWSTWRLLRARRRWLAPAERARVVLTVAAV